ncbi:DUF6049 family protein, partial [Leucobacter sp. M11]|uniref:DUF6049 family protein n=1 Tax=Leucobacter sp. M11 TaxID=2993565 RepID=UPI002D7F2F21
LSDSAEGSAPSEDPAAPSVATLTEWTYTREDVAWPRADTITSDTLTFLRNNGLTTALTTFANTSLSPSGSASGSRDGVTLVPVTAELQAAADQAVLGASVPEQARGQATLTAALALSAAQGPSGVQTLALDRSAVDSEAATLLLNTLSSLPWVSSAPLASGPNGTASLTEMPVPSDRLADLALAVQHETPIAKTSRVLAEPELLVGLQRVRVLRFFSAGIDPLAPEYAEAAKAYFDRDRDTINGISLAGSSATTQLIGTSSRVPVQVRNTLPFDALVTAQSRAVNPSLLVLEPRSEETLIPAESSVNVLIPVSARVSSGESALDVSLENPDGDPVVSAVFPMSIHSTWETLILIVFGSLVLAFFGFGIWRSIRHSRRATRAEAALDDSSAQAE